MSDNVQPIREGIEPRLDIERELIDYAVERIHSYCKEYGPPASIVFVLIGANKANTMTEAYSWTPQDEDSSRLQCCATASAVLMKRALGI